MDELKKTKLIYSGELILFSIAFIVLGVLELIHVINLSENFRLIFKIVTLVGATWLVADFVWALKSEKHRKSSPVMDKAMLLPLAAYLYIFDIYGFCNPSLGYGYYQIGVPIPFFYLACAYIFQGVYHYYKPLPILLEELEKAKEEENKKAEAEEKAEESEKIKEE